MKNKKIISIIAILIVIIVIVLLGFFNSSKLDENIFNIKWYRYNAKSGSYDVFKIDKNELSYFSEENSKNYSNCKRYNYNANAKSLDMDCAKSIIVREYKDDKLVLIIEGKMKTFYSDIDSSLNFEFNNYYKKSLSDYKEEKKQVTELIKIDYNKLLEVLKYDNSYIIIQSDNCSNIECISFLEIIEKWITLSNDIYFFDSSNLKKEDIKKIIKINNKLPSGLESYKSTYPIIIKIKNKISEGITYVDCDGFDCDKYINFINSD